jgi:HD-GYP domain-containing protein (c-di-GMP phosphodiesterase class II)
MKDFLVRDIQPGSYFSKNVYLDNQFALITPEMPFSLQLSKLLQEWEFKEISSEGEPREDYYAGDEDGFLTSNIDETDLSDADKIKRAEEFYVFFFNYVTKLFEYVAVKNELDYKAVVGKVKEACDIIKEDRRFLLRVQKTSEKGNDTDFLVTHAVNSMIISIIIGSYLKLNNARLIELGVAALLHEIGMLKLPPQIYLSKRPLSLPERKAILTHPILGYNLLKSFDFPLAISLAALEHHERENGAGYPQKLTAEKISLYAKIIAVACSYEALTAARTYKEAKDGYSGMLDLLKNEGKQYDDVTVRALVYSLSIYPIGLYVLLSNSKKGQVVDENPENPSFTVVQIFGELTPDGKNRVLETSEDGIGVVRPLTKEETGSL